jgi:hypothetical protein
MLILVFCRRLDIRSNMLNTPPCHLRFEERGLLVVLRARAHIHDAASRGHHLKREAARHAAARPPATARPSAHIGRVGRAGISVVGRGCTL